LDAPPVRNDAWRWVGGGVLTLGLGSIAAATVYGTSAMASARLADCDSDNRCSVDGLADRATARDRLAVSYAVGIAGGVLAVGGLALILLAPDEATRPARLRSCQRLSR